MSLSRKAENHGNMLEREPWGPHQHSPPHLTPRDTRSNTALKTRDTKSGSSEPCLFLAFSYMLIHFHSLLFIFVHVRCFLFIYIAF